MGDWEVVAEKSDVVEEVGMDGEDGEDGLGGGEGEGVDHEDGDGGVGGFYTRRVCSVDSVLRYSHAQLQAKNMK